MRWNGNSMHFSCLKPLIWWLLVTIAKANPQSSSSVAGMWDPSCKGCQIPAQYLAHSDSISWGVGTVRNLLPSAFCERTLVSLTLWGSMFSIHPASFYGTHFPLVGLLHPAAPIQRRPHLVSALLTRYYKKCVWATPTVGALPK